jgi:hypothetical protein
MTKEEFIKKAREIYGKRYDYKNISQTNLEPYTMIPIFCDKHGLFYQTVYDHLQGKGCFDCFCQGEELTDD